MTNRGKTKAQLIEELKETRQTVEKLGALVVEQMAAEKSLRMAQFALDCVPEGAYWMGPDGRFLYVNDAACRFLGYSREELLTMRVSDINPEHPQERWVDHWNKVRERGAVTFETVQQAKDGQIYPVEIAANHFEFDGNMYICSLVRDTTERKGGGEELRSYQKKLRALTSELTKAEWRERRQLATGLHDRVIQILAMARIKVNRLQSSLNASDVPNELREIEELIKSAVSATRTLTFEISPPSLHELGLEAAIDELVETFQKEHGILAFFKDDEQLKPLSHDTRDSVYWAVRELLINVVKHAQAEKVQVHVLRKEEKLVVEVADNGVGFNPAKIDIRSPVTQSFGLFSIRERLRPLGALLEIDSSPNRGTRAILEVPLEN